MEIGIVVAVGVFLMVAWTAGGWLIVRLGFSRDADASAGPRRSDVAAGRAPVDPHADPNAIWRQQMKAATAASGARCDCPTPAPDPDCPVHRWDFT